MAPAGADDGSEQLVTFLVLLRPDTSIEIDVIEEIARHHGYSNIPRRIPSAVRAGSLTPRQHARRLVRQAMLGAGLDEAMPLAFLAPDDLATSGLPEIGITLTNPLAATSRCCARRCARGCESVAYNESHRNEDVALFEIGKVFRPPPAGHQLPDEREELSAVLAWPDARPATEVWVVLGYARACATSPCASRPSPGLHPARSAVLPSPARRSARSVRSTRRARPAGIPGRVAWLQVDLDRRSTYRGAPMPTCRSAATRRAISTWPSRPPTTWPPEGSATHRGQRQRAAGRPCPCSTSSAATSPSGHRSLAFTLRLQAQDRTLTDDDVATMRAASSRGRGRPRRHPAHLTGGGGWDQRVMAPNRPAWKSSMASSISCAGVHHERAVAGDRLVQRFAGEHQHVEGLVVAGARCTASPSARVPPARTGAPSCVGADRAGAVTRRPWRSTRPAPRCDVGRRARA